MDSFHVKSENKGIKFKSDHQRGLWLTRLSQLDGKEFVLSIDERKPKRSERQNAYLWLYIGLIADETGYTKDEVHSLMKGKFLTREIKEVMGQKVRITKSTTDLTKSEFSDYIQEIEAFTGIQSPNTDEFFGYELGYHK